MTEPATCFDLLRHGEPVGGRRFRGQVDHPLSEAGWAQMWAAVGEHRPWARVVSSPLARCREFAAALSERRGLPLTIEPQLAEMGFGRWEGKTPEEVEALVPGATERFYADPIAHPPPGAEPLPAFYARVCVALAELRERHGGEHLLIVCHAGVIRMALAEALGFPPGNQFHVRVEYASITRIRYRAQGIPPRPQLISHAAPL